MPDIRDTFPENVQEALAAAKRMGRALDDVRAIDYGFAYEDGKLVDRPSIRFHMNRKRRLSQVPVDQRLPNTIQGIEVDVLAIGYTPHNGSARAPQSVLQPGISVGNLKLRTTGTLGAIVTDLTTNEISLLSNWHVLCGGPEALANDEITQPGPMDFNQPRTVAQLTRWLRLSEQFDAAIARLTADVRSDGKLFNTEFQPTSTIPPALGMRVLKSGAVSGVTRAMIDGIAGSYRLDYTGFGDAPKWMEGFRLVQDSDAPAKAISLEGDSGSLWVDSTGTQAIGLHFAGEDDDSPLNDYALAHPIQDVFTRLNIALAIP
jgi:hypothetical protein